MLQTSSLFFGLADNLGIDSSYSSTQMELLKWASCAQPHTSTALLWCDTGVNTCRPLRVLCHEDRKDLTSLLFPIPAPGRVLGNIWLYHSCDRVAKIHCFIWFFLILLWFFLFYSITAAFFVHGSASYEVCHLKVHYCLANPQLSQPHSCFGY